MVIRKGRNAVFWQSIATLVILVLGTPAANAQANCLQRRVGSSDGSYSHWVVTNACQFEVKFRSYMQHNGSIYAVFTSPLGRLADANPGLPVTVTLSAGGEQSFYFAAPAGSGHWDFITDNVTR